MTKTTDQIIERLRTLSQEHQALVGDFIDFLANREAEERSLTQEAEHLAQMAFTALWENPPSDPPYGQ